MKRFSNIVEKTSKKSIIGIATMSGILLILSTILIVSIPNINFAGIDNIINNEVEENIVIKQDNSSLNENIINDHTVDKDTKLEVLDKDGRRCPLDNRLVKFSVKGPAEYRGGIAKNKPYRFYTNKAALESRTAEDSGDGLTVEEKIKAHLNHVLQDTLPVECGVNRVMLRSYTKAGDIVVTAKAEGLPAATISLRTQPVTVTDGLTTYMPSDGLRSVFDRGETPAT